MGHSVKNETWGRNRVANLDKQKQQEKELAYVRTALVEVQKALAMNEIKSSRLALRAVDISEEERFTALAALDAKELQIETNVKSMANVGNRVPAERSI